MLTLKSFCLIYFKKHLLSVNYDFKISALNEFAFQRNENLFNRSFFFLYIIYIYICFKLQLIEYKGKIGKEKGKIHIIDKMN